MDLISILRDEARRKQQAAQEAARGGEGTPPAPLVRWKPGDPLLGGKVALIAGGGRGIGEATTRMLSGAGAAVGVLDLERARAESVAASLRSGGASAIPVVADLRDEQQCQQAVDAVVGELGGIDVLASVAGGMNQYGEWKHLEHWSTAEWDLIVHLNLRYVFWLCRAVLPKMVARGGGSIVSVTSISGVFGAPNHAAYGAAKAGLIHFTKTLAAEYGPSGIRVNAVSPGAIATPATNMSEEAKAALGRGVPLRRAGEPDDIARAILFFASPMSDYITGQMLLVDGGAGSKFPFAATGTDTSEAGGFR
jgi:NAD(P)-dependent dehydrogenase (short-subunit alcohol dehydrogenase family)